MPSDEYRQDAGAPTGGAAHRTLSDACDPPPSLSEASKMFACRQDAGAPTDDINHRTLSDTCDPPPSVSEANKSARGASLIARGASPFANGVSQSGEPDIAR